MTGKKVCILIPTYNNAATLKQVLEKVLGVWPHLLVVNDGSTDHTASILSGFPQIQLLSYEKNQGKGFALRKGFELANSLGYEYAITLDSDGQHEPDNIHSLLQAIDELEKDTIIMGARNMDTDGVPRKSSFGNQFSNFWVWVHTAIRLKDTQTGFRAYPLKSIAKHRWFTNKFEFEIEVLVRLAWTGVEIKEVPVLVYYPKDRVSHFRPVMDIARITLLNTLFFLLTLSYHAPRRMLFKKGEHNIFTQIHLEIQLHLDNPLQMAGSVGLGLFFGVFPIWGFQMVVAFLVASWFGLNRIIVLAFSNISLPPLIPLILLASYYLGSFFVSEPVLIPDFSDITLETIYLQINQYLIGAVLLSFLLGGAGFLTTYILMKLRQFRKA